MIVYKIRDWNENFEKSQTRKFKHIPKWVPLPTKHDGKGYRRIMALPDEKGVIIFAAWVLIVQVGAKCPTRGLLLDSDGPLTAEDLSFKTGCPESVFEEALEVLTREEIGWMECEEYDSESGREPFSGATSPPVEQEQQKQLSLHDNTGHDNTGHDSTGQSKKSLPVQDATESEAAFVAAWNLTEGVIKNQGPALIVKRRKSFRARIKDPGWDWKKALTHFPLQCFKTDASPWKPDTEWFVRPDSVPSILAGKYDFTKSTGTQQAPRSLSAGEEFVSGREAKL